MNIYILIAYVVVSALLGIVSNVLANIIQPALQNRWKLVISLFVGLLTLTILLTVFSNNSMVPDNSTITAPRQAETFEYQIRVLSQDTGKEISNAKVTIEIAGIAPLEEYTDSSGFARFTIDESRTGKPGRLLVAAQGYQQCTKSINVNQNELPHIIKAGAC